MSDLLLISTFLGKPLISSYLIKNQRNDWSLNRTTYSYYWTLFTTFRQSNYCRFPFLCVKEFYPCVFESLQDPPYKHQWQTIPTITSFDLQSHRPHWILQFLGQVLIFFRCAEPFTALQPVTSSSATIYASSTDRWNRQTQVIPKLGRILKFKHQQCYKLIKTLLQLKMRVG